MTLRSKQFDDVYFSAHDGFAETQHVFLNGNHLPQAWQGKDNFIIAETGFGTGLNFLAAWDLFEKNARAAQTLRFVSVEKYPLHVDEIAEALSPWRDVFADKLDIFLKAMAQAQTQTQTQERVFAQVTPNVSLDVSIGDANDILPQWDMVVDCWFLDGFKPSANPQMWTQLIFDHMFRLTKINGTFATFTAAGFVKRGLHNSGFSVQKIPGFGRKREMLIGQKPAEGSS